MHPATVCDARAGRRVVLPPISGTVRSGRIPKAVVGADAGAEADVAHAVCGVQFNMMAASVSDMIMQRNRCPWHETHGVFRPLRHAVRVMVQALAVRGRFMQSHVRQLGVRRLARVGVAVVKQIMVPFNIWPVLFVS